MIKEAAGLLQNTVKPIMDQASDIVWFLESNGIVERKDVKSLLTKAMVAQIAAMIIRGIFQVIVTGIVCYTAWRLIH